MTCLQRYVIKGKDSIVVVYSEADLRKYCREVADKILDEEPTYELLMRCFDIYRNEDFLADFRMRVFNYSEEELSVLSIEDGSLRSSGIEKDKTTCDINWDNAVEDLRGVKPDVANGLESMLLSGVLLGQTSLFSLTGKQVYSSYEFKHGWNAR